jgi:uncharacterized protein
MKALPVVGPSATATGGCYSVDQATPSAYPPNRRALAERVRATLQGSEASPAATELSQRAEAFLERCILHAFEYRGERHLLDPVTGILFSLEECSHKFALALAAELRGTELAKAADEAGLNHAKSLLLDLERMESAEGMFRRSAMSLGKMIDRAIEGFLAHQPRKMMLCIAQTCNLRCVYCYAIEGNYHDEGRLMSLATAQQSIRYLARRAGRRRNLTITLFGGEPLINFSMMRELIPWAKAWAGTIGKRVHFCITTNGTLLTDEIIEFLILHKMSIMISLDGPKEVQDLTRPNSSGKGSFDAAAPRIKKLLERHPHPEIIKVRATMTHQSHDTVRLAQFFESFGFKRIGLGANVGYSFYKGPFDMTAEDKAEMYGSTEEFLDQGGLDAIREYKETAFDPVRPSMLAIQSDVDRRGPSLKMPCGVGRNDQGIDVDGVIYPCHRYVGMKAYVMGNVFEGVSVDSLRMFYEGILGAYRHCGDCWANRWCSGHCPNYLSDPTGRSFGPDDTACDALRAGLQRNLALHSKLSSEGVDWRKVEGSQAV